MACAPRGYGGRLVPSGLFIQLDPSNHAHAVLSVLAFCGAQGLIAAHARIHILNGSLHAEGVAGAAISPTTGVDRAPPAAVKLS